MRNCVFVSGLRLRPIEFETKQNRSQIIKINQTNQNIYNSNRTNSLLACLLACLSVIHYFSTTNNWYAWHSDYEYYQIIVFTLNKKWSKSEIWWCFISKVWLFPIIITSEDMLSMISFHCIRNIKWFEIGFTTHYKAKIKVYKSV